MIRVLRDPLIGTNAVACQLILGCVHVSFFSLAGWTQRLQRSSQFMQFSVRDLPVHKAGVLRMSLTCLATAMPRWDAVTLPVQWWVVIVRVDSRTSGLRIWSNGRWLHHPEKGGLCNVHNDTQQNMLTVISSWTQAQKKQQRRHEKELRRLRFCLLSVHSRFVFLCLACQSLRLLYCLVDARTGTAS